MSYIKPQFTPPSPLSLASFLAGENGKKFSLFWLHHVANPPNTLAKTVGRLWSDVREEVWFGSIFQRLIVL
jgi:hypothetical protein